MTSFDPAHFADFCNDLKINSKEEGVISLGQSLLGTQRRFLREVQIGMEMGVRDFVTLKSRQIGLSTICMAFDLYWPSQYDGIGGAIIVHEDAARSRFRATLEMYYEGLSDDWQIDIVQHNRDQLVLANGSMLEYKVAGIKETSKKTLGRSSALSYLHATEVAFWGDAEQVQSLRSTLAEKNPTRFYNWETTANGFNHFYDMWCDAKKAVSQRAIFIGWWANELSRKARDSQEYQVYWGHKGRPSAEERDWIKQVKSLYGVEIDAEQMAWYRWMRGEKVTDDTDIMQEHPPTEEHAFVATGSKFFTGQNLSDNYKRVLTEPAPTCYRFQFGAEFTDTRLVECQDKIAQLRVWEEPEDRAFYVIGADPAYGVSDTSDRYAIEVYRCYSNRMEQVTEFAAVDISTYAFAWVIVYLAGAYQPSILNCEVNGPGEAVLREIENLKKLAGRSHSRAHSSAMRDVVAKIQQYYFRRLDSIGGMPSAMHTLTNERSKEVMMTLYKDYFERGILVTHSRRLLDEMKAIVREDGRAPAASGTSKDDRVMASALATLAWNDQLRTRLIAQNVIWLPPKERPAIELPATDTTVSRQVRNYLQDIGVLRGLIPAEHVGTRTARPHEKLTPGRRRR